MAADRDAEIEGLLAAYVDRLNRGERIDADRVLAENPFLGEELLSYLEAYLGAAPSEDPREPLGKLGDFTLRRRIGTGGMGVVYEAWEGSMGRAVALKVLPAGAAADERAFHRFMREARTAGMLAHPNVVPVYGVGITDRTPYTGGPRSPRRGPRSPSGSAGRRGSSSSGHARRPPCR